MLKSFKAENFRGFKKFELPKLNRINLILGKNNVGKTALLEAITLLVGANNPGLTFQLNQNRGFVAPLDYKELWGWLFHHRSMKLPINMEAEDDKGHQHYLRMNLENSKKVTLEVSDEKKIDLTMEVKDTLFNSPQNKELKFTYHQDDQETKINRAVIHKNRIEISQVEPVFPLSMYLPGNEKFNSATNAVLLSQLQNVSRLEKVIEIMKIIEPKLVSLAISYVGGMPNIMVDIGKKTLMPINFMGDGMTRLLTIFLSIANVQSGGCLLIDEIDNGFYYGVMQKIWEAIGVYSEEFDVQIIATTHSFECVKAAHKAYKNIDVYPLSVHRLERTDDKIEAITYNKNTLGTSFELGWEIR